MDASDNSRPKTGFFFGGLDVPDEQAEELYGKEDVKRARGEIDAELEIEWIVQSHRSYSERGRLDPKLDERVERLLWFYDNLASTRARIVWALGEMGCRESVVLIGGIVRNWEKNLDRNGILFILAAVEALGKLATGANATKSLNALMVIAEDRAAPEALRAKAASASEKVAGRMNSLEFERVRERIKQCGAERLRGKAWGNGGAEKKKRVIVAVQRKGGVC